MQCRRQHSSSGELGVFRATRYFAGHAHGDTDATDEPADRPLNQAKVVLYEERTAESFRGHVEELRVHNLRHDHQELPLAKPAGKNLFTSFFGFMLFPSPGASFRKNLPPPPPTTSRSAASSGEGTAKVSSSTISGESTGNLSASAAIVQFSGRGYGLDLGAATGDRRLQGVRVVRGSSGVDDEKWVVKCTSSCWYQEEQQHDDIFNAADHRYQVEEEDGEDGNNPGDWDGDSSSDLFDLDIEYIDL